jgi:hypothetical protein
MEYDEQISPTVDMIDLVNQRKLDSLCKVCGSDGAQIHYGELCCVSCKMFFRRNAHYNLVS